MRDRSVSAQLAPSLRVPAPPALPTHPDLPETGLVYTRPPQRVRVQEASVVWRAETVAGALAVKRGWAYSAAIAWSRWAPLREAELLRALDVAPVLGGPTPGGTWCARPWYTGANLAESAQRGPGDLARAAAGAARALDELHARGWIHRDFAPEHALRTADGTTHLVDLALAHAPDVPLTAEANISYPGGNPRFEAPELAAGAPATPASDTYAWAASIYYIVTGTTVTDADNPMTPSDRIIYRAATVAGHRRPPLTGVLGPAIEPALHPDPSRRPALCDLADRLDQIADENRT